MEEKQPNPNQGNETELEEKLPIQEDSKHGKKSFVQSAKIQNEDSPNPKTCVSNKNKKKGKQVPNQSLKKLVILTKNYQTKNC